MPSLKITRYPPLLNRRIIEPSGSAHNTPPSVFCVRNNSDFRRGFPCDQQVLIVERQIQDTRLQEFQFLRSDPDPSREIKSEPPEGMRGGWEILMAGQIWVGP